MIPKTVEQMMGEMTDPKSVERNTRYQNARDAVAWAWKIAQEKIEKIEDMPMVADAIAIAIEDDLNKTLDVLKETNDGRN